jgi:hypothetical protein
MSARIEKQVAINQLYKIPLEVLDIVKSYLWYDVQTASVRKHKQEVCDKIKVAISRNTTDIEEDYLSEFWYFGLDQIKRSNHHHFAIHGQNCFTCGNYIPVLFSIFPEKIACRCIENQLEMELNFLEDEHPEWDFDDDPAAGYDFW